jgi:hypothetical protein
MKRNIILTVIISLSVSFSAIAQKQKIKFHSIEIGGIAGGESQVKPVFQTINGLGFSRWFSAVGIGIDYYRYKTLPLFIDVRRFFGKENKGFLYADLGYNFPLKNKPGKEIGYYDTYHFKGGVYTDIGIGYKTKFIKRSSLLFSMGHSYKELQNEIGITPLCTECQPYFYYYKFGFGRIAFKAGVEF